MLLVLQQVANILTSLSRVFNTDSVLLTLCGEQRVWIRNAIGFAAGEFEWRWAFCGWSLAPPSPQVLVIEDTLQDARYTFNYECILMTMIEGRVPRLPHAGC